MTRRCLFLPATQIDQDMTALLNMADAEFSFQNKGKIYHPQWYAPEGELSDNLHKAECTAVCKIIR